ncbi:MAG: polysaccharide biosynthesis C-terminal domain-containing protein [Blautia wexlerae]
MLCIFSLLLTVSFLLLKDQLLMLFEASDATFPYANTYLTIYTAGTFFALMATGLNYFINCQGFPLVGMTTVFIGAIANIILDPVFIFALHMGIAGAAIATVISQFLSLHLPCSFSSEESREKGSCSDHLWSVQFPGDETDHRTGILSFSDPCH